VGKTSFTTFGPPRKIWNNPLVAPPGKNPSDPHGSCRVQASEVSTVRTTSWISFKSGASQMLRLRHIFLFFPP